MIIERRSHEEETMGSLARRVQRAGGGEDEEVGQRVGVGGGIGCAATAVVPVAAQLELAGEAAAEKAGSPDNELNRLRRENEQLALSLAKRQLEVDFFRGALRRYKDGRPNSTSSGVGVPTPKSE